MWRIQEKALEACRIFQKNSAKFNKENLRKLSSLFLLIPQPQPKLLYKEAKTFIHTSPHTQIILPRSFCNFYFRNEGQARKKNCVCAQKLKEMYFYDFIESEMKLM